MRGKLSKKELKKALNDQLSGSGEVEFLSKSDENDALDVLAVAFKTDPMIVWVADLEGKEEEEEDSDELMYNLSRSMHEWINHRILNGSRGVAMGVRGPSNELVGCMTLAPSSCAKYRMIDSLVATIKYGILPMYKSKERYGPHSRKRLESLNVAGKHQQKNMKDTKRWIYLQGIGVRPEQHGKGYGKRMLQLLTRTADSIGVSVYLETEAEELESMYKRFGFHAVEKLDLCVEGDDSASANFTMYLMRRDPEEGGT